MPCLIVLIGLLSPRLAIFLLALFSNDISRAFHGGWVTPLLGFFLLPWTTLVYTLTWQSGRTVDGFEWLLVAVAFLLDLGSWSGSDRFRRRRD
jgi:hypothetical protein